MESLVQQHYLNRELPGIDLILLGNGLAITVYTYPVENHSHEYNKMVYHERRLMPICDTTIQSLEKYNDEIWTSITFHPEYLLLKNGNKVVFGQGEMGNEGFIACEYPDGKLNWAFFTTALNPFHKVEQLDSGYIKAYSTNEQVIILDPNTPWNIDLE